MLVGILVEIAQILAGGLLVTTEVIVRTVGDAPQLAPVGEREGVFDIRGGTGVEGELGLLMVAQAQMLLFDAEGEQPLLAVVLPVGEPLEVGPGLAEDGCGR